MSNALSQQALVYTIQSRENLVSLLDSLSLDQLNLIPEGFNNNILWNAAHSLVTQQLLCYKLAGVPMLLEKDFVTKFSKGTKAAVYTKEDLDFVLQNAVPLIEQLKIDLDQVDFSNYFEYTTSFGTTLRSIEDAISFNCIHEGLHLGYMMAQKRTILANY